MLRYIRYYVVLCLSYVIEHVRFMSCYITCHLILCYITCYVVMLYNMLSYAMLYNMLCCVMFILRYKAYNVLYHMLFYVTLYNMLCYVSYITRYVYVMLYNILFLCYITCYVVL